MPSINCLTCGYRQTEDIPARFVGRSVKCPQCRRRVDVMADASSAAIDFPIDDSPGVERLGTQIAKVAAKTESVTPITFVDRRETRKRGRGTAIVIVTVLCGVSFLIGVFASPQIKPNDKPAPNLAGNPLAAKRPNNAPPAAPQPVANDDALELVRQYLKENTNSGEWEEIRWLPGFTMSTKLHIDVLGETYNVNAFRQGGFALDSLSLIDICRADPTLRFVRMKYRTNNEFGNPAVKDDIYVVQNMEVRTLRPNQLLLMHLAWESLEAAEAGIALRPEIPPEKLANDAFNDAIRQMAK